MGRKIQVASLILVATFARLLSLEVLPTIRATTVRLQPQLRAANTSGSGNFNCTAAGRFPNPANCSLYYFCAINTATTFTLYNLTCPNQLSFDPLAQQCTTNASVCSTTSTTTPSPSVCLERGFICNNETSYRDCEDAGVPLPIQACASGYFCNNKCSQPCTNYVPLC